jgi:hypothetical protein
MACGLDIDGIPLQVFFQRTISYRFERGPFHAAQHLTSGNRDGSKANATERRKRLARRATMAQGA